MSKRDYYEVLGVAKNADEAALKSAFRKLAMQYHPDKNPGDKQAEAKFKELNEAYQCLSDPQKRGAYDRFGHAAFEQGGGEGEAGLRGGPAGDLYVFLSVKPHKLFQRDGADLFARVPISMVAAALGTEISVPTLDGSEAKVKVPEGTQSGKQFRVKAKGMPVLRSKDRGDLFIQIMVETPQNLTKRQRELLREFEEGSSGATQPETEGFFARMKKDFFGG